MAAQATVKQRVVQQLSLIRAFPGAEGEPGEAKGPLSAGIKRIPIL
jgi:hypothetical protein